MMGVLIKLGRGEVGLDYIENSLKENSDIKIDFIAPASGLIQKKIEY